MTPLVILAILIHTIGGEGVFAQDLDIVRNVRFSHADRAVIVLYDLVDDSGDRYNVDVVLRRESDDSFRYIPAYVSGDVGLDVVPGRDRKVIWEIVKEFPEGLIGDDYYFTVDVDRVSTGVGPLVWIGGAVIVGVGTALFLLNGKEAAPIPEAGYSPPPGRP